MGGARLPAAVTLRWMQLSPCRRMLPKLDVFGGDACCGVPDLGYRHRPRTQGTPERAAKLLPHIHRVFGNLKTWLGGTHHGVGHDHLQVYLDEFAFRFNRRRTPMAAFQTLLGVASAVHGPTSYDMLYRSESTR